MILHGCLVLQCCAKALSLIHHMCTLAKDLCFPFPTRMVLSSQGNANPSPSCYLKSHTGPYHNKHSSEFHVVKNLIFASLLTSYQYSDQASSILSFLKNRKLLSSRINNFIHFAVSYGSHSGLIKCLI